MIVLEQSGRKSEKQLDSGYILKVAPTQSLDGLNVHGRESPRMSPICWFLTRGECH